MKLLSKFATRHLYTSGPKTGEPSKIMPDALNAQGIQPGAAGQKLGAEEMNYLLNRLIHNSIETRMALFDSFREYAMPSGGGTFNTTIGSFAPISIGRNPRNGRLYTGLFETASDDLIFLALDESGKTFESVTGGSIETAGTHASGFVTFEASPNVAGSPGLYVISAASGDDDIRVFRSNASGNADEFTSVGTHAPGLGTGLSAIAAAYDADNEAITIVVRFSSTIYCLRVADHLTAPVLAAATTEPTYEAPQIGGFNGLVAASGGGVALFGYLRDSDYAARFYSSNDGGVTWVQAGLIPTTDATSCLSDLEYYPEDFLGQGPGFVCVIRQDDGVGGDEHVIYHSPDGVTWSLMQTIETFGTSGNQARLFGDCLVSGAHTGLGSDCAVIYNMQTKKELVVHVGFPCSIHRDRDMTRLMAHVGTRVSFTDSIGLPKTLSGDSFF